MKTKFEQFINEDSFEGRYEKNKNISIQEIEKVIQDTIDGFADEGVYDFKVVKYEQIDIFVTMKAIKHFNISDDDPGWKEDMINLVKRIRNFLYLEKVFINIETLNAIKSVIKIQN